MVFHREHNTHMLCEMQKFANMWPRRPQQDFILPPNIRLHRHPHWPNSCKIFCQTSSVLTCRNCTVCQCSWCSMEGISLLITPATILSPFYPDLWMCPVRDSGLFTFLAQILIVPIQLLYFPSFTEHGSRIRNFTHTHTLSLSLFPIPWLFSIPPVSCSLFDQSVQVLVLHMICQTLFGSKLAASLSAATYLRRLLRHVLICLTKDCKQSQSSFELMRKE